MTDLPMTVYKNKTENTFVYYYNRTKDVFVNKMEFLLLNGDVDCIVVDDTLLEIGACCMTHSVEVTYCGKVKAYC